jgi:hypothetical protein
LSCQPRESREGMPPSEYASRPAPENEVVITAMRIAAPVSPRMPEDVDDAAGSSPLKATASPTSGPQPPVRAVSGSADRPRARRARSGRRSRRPPRCRRTGSGQRPAGLASFGGFATVSSPVGEHRHWMANDRAPGRRRPQVGALAEVLEREEERQAETTMSSCAPAHACDRDREPVEARTADAAAATAR